MRVRRLGGIIEQAKADGRGPHAREGTVHHGLRQHAARHCVGDALEVCDGRAAAGTVGVAAAADARQHRVWPKARPARSDSSLAYTLRKRARTVAGVCRKPRLHFAGTGSAWLELAVDVVDRAAVRDDHPLEAPRLPKHAVEESAVRTAGHPILSQRQDTSARVRRDMGHRGDEGWLRTTAL